MKISWDFLQSGVKTTLSKTIDGRRGAWSEVIPTDSGALITAPNKFIALSLTDSESRTSTGQVTASEWYDWGFTVLPKSILTPQVLIGWG
jgi:hypothetical protein